MKRLVTGLILLALISSLVVGLPVAAQEGGVNISIQPSEVAVQVGEEFTVDIQIDAGEQQVTVVDAFLDFDPMYLQVIDITPGDVLDWVLLSRFNNELGTIDYCAATFTLPPPWGTFTMATITLTAMAETPGTSLNFSTVPPRETSAAFGGNDVTGVITDGMVTVGTVQTPAEDTQDLISDVEELNLPQGMENSLISKLENAINSLDNGQDNAAINKLNAFINQVEAQRGKKITDEQADELIAEAQRIIDSI